MSCLLKACTGYENLLTNWNQMNEIMENTLISNTLFG